VAQARRQPQTKKAPGRPLKPRAAARPGAAPTPAAAPRKERPVVAFSGGVDRLHQVAMTATNLDESVAFYRDTLGLKFIARFDPPGLAFFNLGGGTRLMLSATYSAATLYFLVDDVQSAYADFRKRGISFLQPPAMIHRDDAGQFGKKGNEEWMAFFKDPAGNTLALVEKRQ
jgi:catechol 2,3-dioxygenase-like lactoylglutathione lyase family enzyme